MDKPAEEKSVENPADLSWKLRDYVGVLLIELSIPVALYGFFTGQRWLAWASLSVLAGMLGWVVIRALYFGIAFPLRFVKNWSTLTRGDKLIVAPVALLLLLCTVFVIVGTIYVVMARVP